VDPISQFDLDVIDDKLYVIKTNHDKSIQAGTEIISLDSINPSNLVEIR
jgi:hypothetical protein